MPRLSEEESTPLRHIIEHTLNPADVAQKYNCQLNMDNLPASMGLTQEAVRTNQEKYGSNKLPEPKRKHPVLIYLTYLSNLFSIMLIVSGLLSFVVFILNTSNYTSLYVGIIFILVAFFNAFLEFYQELKSKQVLEGFKALMEQSTKVIRNGQIQQIDVNDLAVGDILVLQMGDTVPADARIVACHSMKVDMSSLTGESVPIERNAEVSQLSADKASCLIFKSSAVTSGHCTAIAIRVGQKTLIGAILAMSFGAMVVEGELGREIKILIRRITLCAAITGSIFMGVAFIQGLGVTPAFEAAIGIFVAFLPQGLPMTITILLTKAAERMAAKQVLVKNLQAVETLGSLTVIATDKTGTLTKNQMEVLGGWMNGTVYENILEKSGDFRSILDCFAGSTTVQFDPSRPIDPDTIITDATELGLLRYALAVNYDLTGFIATITKVIEVPFDSARKWNLNIIRKLDGSILACLKGAPDRLIHYSNVTLDSSQSFDAGYRHFAGEGQRVIGFAVKPIRSEADLEQYRKDPMEIELSGFDFLGMVSIYDPPKEDVLEAVVQLKRSGIRVFMVTGDHPITAKAIAKKVGIVQHDAPIDLTDVNMVSTLPEVGASLVIHGDLVDDFTPQHWRRVSKATEIVFARTLPRHKLMIVKALQAQGEIVGSIGDGVNDSPAIKKANLGISMNKTGSDISKDAAEMVLLDDRFASIVSGVYEGRLIFQNLKKSIRYTLTHIFPEVASFASWVLFLIPPPLTPILVLMIDVGSELGPALSFAYEPAEVDLLNLPPRKRLLPKPDEDVPKRSVMKRAWQFVTKPFSLAQNGEALIDGELVRWTYFQGGIIEAIGCFGAYLLTYVIRSVPLSSLWRSTDIYFYNPTQDLTLTTGQVIGASQQVKIMEASQGGYYLAIVIGQLFNLFVTKSRYKYPFHKGAFVNRATYYGALAAVLVAVFVVFIPGVQYAFGTNYISAIALAPPFAMGFFMLGYEMLRHKLHRLGYFGGIKTGQV